MAQPIGRNMAMISTATSDAEADATDTQADSHQTQNSLALLAQKAVAYRVAVKQKQLIKGRKQHND